MIVSYKGSEAGDVRVLVGDCRDVLASLPAESVDCVATSPPFFGLRDYGTGTWEGGGEGCDHAVRPSVKTASSTLGGGKSTTGHQREGYHDVCARCGARRVDRQIGREATPEEWAAELVAVFAECRRVLRPAGSLWIECGDSYATSAPGSVNSPNSTTTTRGEALYRRGQGRFRVEGYKTKDLIGQPFLLAFALRADGWYWRGCYPWAKPNAMPESVKDRCTTSHSYVLHFAKSGKRTYWTHRDGRLVGDRPAPDYRWVHQTTGEERTIETLGDEWRRINLWRGYDYFFDGDAIAEPAAWERWGDQTVPKYEGTATATGWMQSKTKAELRAMTNGSGSWDSGGMEHGKSTWPDGRMTGGYAENASKHPRSVWTISTQGFPGAHFAVFPEALVERIILAGCPKRVCGTCGKPSERLTEAEYVKSPVHGAGSVVGRHYETGANNFDGAGMPRVNKQVTTVGWSDCGHGNYQPGVILDPFGGSGTTAVAARRLGRHAILIELNEEYARMAAERVANWWKAPTREREADPAQTSLLAEPGAA